MFKDDIKSHRLPMPIAARLDIGDWSEDGHGSHEAVDYRINYPVADLQQAYRESCQAMGIQFNHNQNFMQPDGENVYDQICTEYGESYIRKHELAVLYKFGVLTDERLENMGLYQKGDDGICISEAKDLAQIIMYFIAYSMPEDFVFTQDEKLTIPYINGHWGDLNVQFGYGIF